jgi:hypothetical protein
MKKFIYIDETTGLEFESNSYESTDFISTSAGVADAGKPIVLDAGGQIDASMINDGDIDHANISGIGVNSHIVIDSHLADTVIHSTRIDDDTMATATSTNVPSAESVVAYINSVLVSEMSYKGAFDAAIPSPDLNAIASRKGDFYKVTVAGTYLGIELAVADSIIINKDVAIGAIVAGDIDKIDNTESPDILREGDLTSGQVFVGNASNIATAVVLTGDVTVSNAGVTAIGALKVTNDMLAGSIADGKLVEDYIKTSEVDNTSIQFTGGVLNVKNVAASLVTVVDAGSYFVGADAETVLQEIGAALAPIATPTYTVGVGGVTKGLLVYLSSNNTVSAYASGSNHCIGVALSTETAGQTVKVVANDVVVSSVGTGLTVGQPIYWNGTAYTQTFPAGSGAYVWQIGYAKNATDIKVDVEFRKRNM